VKESFEEYKKTIEDNLINFTYLYDGDVIDSEIRYYEESAFIKFSKGINYIYGLNAQGKTNILEAIFLCASARSHRTSKDFELIKLNESWYKVEVVFNKGGMDTSIEILYKINERKKIYINEIHAKKIGKLMGNMNVVMFSPEDLSIINDGPSERRRFVDIGISQIKPSYFYKLQNYSRIVLQRNNILKKIRETGKNKDVLEIWNENLIKTGSEIMIVRYNFAEIMEKYAKIWHKELTNGEEDLFFKYKPSIKVDNEWNIKNVYEKLREKLEINKKKEIEKGQTITGPQRDDYDIKIGDMNTKIFGSQGQKRTAILSIKLAEIDIMKEETNEYPILLLDDVMSELDEKRQLYVLNNIKGIQTIITCTGKEGIFIKKKDNKKYFYVKNGEVMLE